MRPIIKGRVHYDEKVIHIGKKYCYDLNAIDSKTKYILAHSFVEKRTLEKCVEFLKQVKITCYEQLLERYQQKKNVVFVCDKFGNYRRAFNKIFFLVAKLHFGIPIKSRVLGLQHNNNPIERYNGDLKDRLKIMRGGFGSFTGAEEFLNLKHIIHNFVNPHQSIKGKTPAEIAGVSLDLGRQKLLTLINIQGEKTHHSLR